MFYTMSIKHYLVAHLLFNARRTTTARYLLTAG
jgi:hypothetical protein